MNDIMQQSAGAEIVVDELFPHAPDLLWRTLTTTELIGRWLMQPTGFAPIVGKRFTYQTTPAGEWDGVIHCEVLEAIPNRRLVYTWKGGHDANTGYGARLDTVVAWTLTPAPGGTRLRLVHSGFQSPRNDSACAKMTKGWPIVLQRINAIAAEPVTAESFTTAPITTPSPASETDHV